MNGAFTGGGYELERRAMFSRPHGFLPQGYDESPYNRWLGEGHQQQQQQPQPGQYFGNMHLNAQTMDVSQIYSGANRYNALWVFVDVECSNLDPSGANFGILEIAAGVVDDNMSLLDTFHVVVHQPRYIIANSSKWCKQHFCSRLEGGNDLFAQCEASTISERDAGQMLHAFILKHARKRVPNEASTAEHIRRKYFEAAELVPVEKMVEECEAGTTPETKAEVEFGPPASGNNNDGSGGQQESYYRLMFAGCSTYFDRSVLLTRFPHLKSIVSHKVIDLSGILEMARRWRPDLLKSLPPSKDTHRALVDMNESVSLLKWFWRSFIMSAQG